MGQTDNVLHNNINISALWTCILFYKNIRQMHLFEQFSEFIPQIIWKCTNVTAPINLMFKVLSHCIYTISCGLIEWMEKSGSWS